MTTKTSPDEAKLKSLKHELKRAKDAVEAANRIIGE
jgi:hypothetical protein